MLQVYRQSWLVALIGVVFASLLEAHPVPRQSHDRTVVVQVTPSGIVVDYRLEIDEWTVVYVDLPAVEDKVDLKKLKTPAEFHVAFVRCYGPILARNLSARLDGTELEFRCTEQAHRVADHFQCDFRFTAERDIAVDKEHTLDFRDGNFELESGMLRLSVSNRPETPIVRKSEPDEALKSRPATELKPGDDEKLRKAAVTFQVEKNGERLGPGDMPIARAKSSP